MSPIERFTDRKKPLATSMSRKFGVDHWRIDENIGRDVWSKETTK